MSCDYNYFPTRKHRKPVDSEANMKWKRSLGHCRRFIITHYGCHFSFSFIIFACAVAFLASPTVGGDTKTEQVERNGCHKITELRDLTLALADISDWTSLGYELGVPHKTIQTIETDEKGTENKRRAMLCAWYDLQDHDPCWQSVTDALRRLGKNRLATKIEQCVHSIQSGTDCTLAICMMNGVDECTHSYNSIITTDAIMTTVSVLLALCCCYFNHRSPQQDTESHVDGTIVLGEDDLRDVRSAVADLAARWKDLGISLGICSSDVDAIFSANPYSPSDCLREMLTLWLKQNYNVERFGKPTWRRLVKAVEDKVGGNNCALSKKIAKEHPAAPGLPAGIYETYNSNTCRFIADNCKANIIVVENQTQLEKILEVRDRLPHLKAIVQYKGQLSQEYPNVYEWEEFLEKGSEIETSVVEEKINSQKPDECALLIYTPGTTGDPKGVMLSHDNLTFTARALDRTYGGWRDGKDHAVSYIPLSHIAAQMTDIYLPLLVGATVFFAQPDAINGSLGETLREVKPTFFFGVPRVYETLMEGLQEHDTSTGLKRVFFTWLKNKVLKGNLNRQENCSLPWGWTVAERILKKVLEEVGLQQCEIFAVGAAPMRREVHEYFMSINVRLMELYGLSESSGPHTLNLIQPDRWKLGSCGKTIMGVQIKILEPNENGEGEICLHGRNVFMGYLNNEEETIKAIDSDGWLHTGDIGKVQDDFLYITGRIKELIVMSDGENIPPVPIENRIKNEIPFLSNVIVIGDQRKFLTCLMTLKCEMDPKTKEFMDTLTPHAQQMVKAIGSCSIKVSDVLYPEDRAVFTAIQEGLDKANEHATSQAQVIQKWTLLDSDFSIRGGELGPTMKIRRHVVHKKYATTIEAMYSES